MEKGGERGGRRGEGCEEKGEMWEMGEGGEERGGEAGREGEERRGREARGDYDVAPMGDCHEESCSTCDVSHQSEPYY